MGRAYSPDEEANLRDEMNEDAMDDEDIVEEEEEVEDESWYDEQEDVYGPDGEVVYSPYYESLKVDRKCEGCGRHFRGMPDHGFCDSCADIRERGGELPGLPDEENEG